MAYLGRVTVIYILISIIITLIQSVGESLLSGTVNHIFNFITDVFFNKLSILPPNNDPKIQEHYNYYNTIAIVLLFATYLLTAIYSIAVYLLFPFIVFRIINTYITSNKEIKIQVHTSPVIEIKLLLTWLVFYVLSYMITIIGIPDIVFFLIKIVIFYFLLSNNFFNYKIT